MTKYIYPQLPSSAITTSFVRIGGSGLANCLFVYSRAIVRAKRENLRMIAPTWLNLSIGTYLRREKDKRHYGGIFSGENEVQNPRKAFLLLFKRNDIIVEEGLGNYFVDILQDVEEISHYIIKHVSKKQLEQVDNFNFQGYAAVHIRLGDYIEKYRTPIDWFLQKVRAVHERYNYNILLFSDGSDFELAELLKIDYVKRANFGSAMSDMIAISRCEYLIGSDSTFSGWGAYLGQIPCVFYRKHFGRVLKDESKEITEFKDNVWE